MKNAPGRTVSLAVAAVLFGASQGLAQDPAFRPVFGGRAGVGTIKQAVDLTVDVAEAYDDNLLADSGTVLPSLFQVSGFYTLLTPRVAVKSNSDRFQIALNVGSSARYFAKSKEFLVTNHDAGVGFNAEVTRHTTFELNQGVAYAPSTLNGLFPGLDAPASGEGFPPESSYAVDAVRSYVYMTGTSLTHNVSPRAALRFNAGYRFTDIIGSHAGYSDLRSYDGGGRFTYGLNRDVKLRLGYTYRQAQYSPVLHPTEHDVEIGLEYSRPLSRTRATGVGFSVGPQRVSRALIGQESGDTYGTAADFWLKHQFGRSWSVQSGYHRGMTFTEVLQSPTYTNGITTGVGGFLNRRTGLQISGAYSTGELALAGAPSPFATYTSNVRLEVAANRVLATYAEYFYYFYHFDPSIQLPVGVPHDLTRNGVRAGLTLWVPVRHR